MDFKDKEIKSFNKNLIFLLGVYVIVNFSEFAMSSLHTLLHFFRGNMLTMKFCESKGGWLGDCYLIEV